MSPARTDDDDGVDEPVVGPDREDGAPAGWDPDRTGPSRDDEPAPGNVGRSEPWTETAETAQGGFRSDDDPQAGEAARPPHE